MAVGTTTALMLGAAGAFAAGKLTDNQRSNRMNLGQPLPLPQAPSVAEAQARSEDIIKKKKSAMSQTVYTSPLGVSGQADIAKKTLLGT